MATTVDTSRIAVPNGSAHCARLVVFSSENDPGLRRLYKRIAPLRRGLYWLNDRDGRRSSQADFC
jgi:hypothetical protein